MTADQFLHPPQGLLDPELHSILRELAFLSICKYTHAVGASIHPQQTLFLQQHATKSRV